MPTAKITLTLEQDDERGTNEAMEETLQLLTETDTMPLMKLVLTIECEEIAAERYRAKLRSILRTRPIGIVAKFRTTTDEDVTREVMRPVTPMDKVWEPGKTTTITLGPEHYDALEKAATTLRGMGPGDENLFDDDEAA